MHCLSDGTHANTSVLLCHAEQLEVTFLKLILTYDPLWPLQRIQAGYEQDADARGQEARNRGICLKEIPYWL